MLVLEVVRTPDGSSPILGTRVNVMGAEAQTLGRSPHADLRFRDRSVSRQHLRFLPRASGWVVEDLKSTNGTMVNGKIVKKIWPLKEDDTVRCGGFTLNVKSVSRPMPDGPVEADETQLADFIIVEGEVPELVAVNSDGACNDSWDASLESYSELVPIELTASDLRYDQIEGIAPTVDQFYDAAIRFIEQDNQDA